MSKQTDLINVTDAITVSGSNVGIGTSSPDLSGFGSGTNGLDISDATLAGLRLNGNAADSLYLVSGADRHWVLGRGAVPMTFSTNGTERMRIDATGAVTMPHQPAFSAKVASKITNISVGGSTNTTIPFGTQIFDQNADYDTNGIFTAPVGGKYQLSFFLRLEEVDASSSAYSFYIVTSNRTYSYIFDPDFGSQDVVYYHANLSVLADMDAGDTAKIQYYVQAGASQTDIATSSNFMGHLVC